MTGNKRTWVIVDCDRLERRAAVLEDGKLVDLEVEREPPLAESIFKGVVRQIAPGIDAAFVDIGAERLGFLPISEVVPGALGVSEPQNGETFRSIHEAVQVGDTVLVQVHRFGSPMKGPGLTTVITLKGRYCVLVCQGSDSVGVSHQITDDDQRDRLRRLGEQFRPLDCGLIMRHHALIASAEDIAKDVEGLKRRWDELNAKFLTAPAPSLLYRRPSFFAEILWDMIPSTTERVIVDGHPDGQELVQIAREIRPDLVDKIELYDGLLPIFEAFNVEPQIRSALARQISLPSGGFLVVEETEAGTVIDVNTGRAAAHPSPSDTILETNLEAVEEVARQLRIRDLGGVILVDLVDVLRSRERQQVLKALERAIRRDRKSVRIIDLTPLGLLEITRQRQGPSLWRELTQECPHCGGRGRVKSAFTVSLELARQIRSTAAATPEDVCTLLVICHPEVASWLLLGKEMMEQLERRIGKAVVVYVNEEYSYEKFTVRSSKAELTTALTGRSLTVDPAALLPPEEPTFAVFENRLVRMPEGEIRPGSRVIITAVGRWWCESRWDPGEKGQDRFAYVMRGD